MNWQLMLGVLLGAAATYFLTIGAGRLTKKDNEPLEQKVGEVLKKIDEVRSESGPAQQQKLDAIEHDFSAWAADFQTNKTSRRLALDQSRLKAQATSLERMRAVRLFFSDFLNYVARSADAYSNQTGRKINYDLPPLPEQAFTPHSAPWRGTVTFAEDAHWKLFSGTGVEGTAKLFVSVAEQDGPDSDLVVISADPDKSKWSSRVKGPNYAPVPELEVPDLPLSDREALKKLVQRAFETQILLSFPQ